MCLQPRYIAQCDCSVVDNVELCRKAVVRGNRPCNTPTVENRKGKWGAEYCPEHERLRQHHDAQDMLVGKKTIHGLTYKTPYAQLLRHLGFLKDPEYYNQYPELPNPYANGRTVESMQETVESMQEPAIRGGELNETWAEFLARKGGKILPPKIDPRKQVSKSSAFSDHAKPDEDWTKISDPVERKKMQNRINQRKHSKCREQCEFCVSWI